MLRAALVVLALTATQATLPRESHGQSPRRIDGRVVDDQGTALAGVRVRWFGVGAQTATVMTDSLGRFRFSQLPPDTLRLIADRVGYQPTTAEVVIKDSTTRSLTITLAALRDAVDSLALEPVVQAPDSNDYRALVPTTAVLRVRAVRPRPVIMRRGGAVWVRVFPDVLLRLQVNAVSSPGDGRQDARGDVRRVSDDAPGEAVLVVRGRDLTADFTFGRRAYLIRPRANGTHVVMEVDLALLTPPRVPRPPAPAPPEELGGPFRDASPAWFGSGEQSLASLFASLSASSRPALVTPSALGDLACHDEESDVDVGRRPQVRVLVAYTPAARDEQSGTTAPSDTAKIIDLIRNAILKTQDALDRSEVGVDVALAGTVLLDVVDDGSLYGTFGFLDLVLNSPSAAAVAVRTARDRFAADAIGVVNAGAIGGTAGHTTWPRPGFADSAVFVTAVGDINAGFEFVHEFGHILGAQDPRPLDARANRPPVPYAAAIRCVACEKLPGTSTDLKEALGVGWVTVMEYPNDVMGLEAIGLDANKYKEYRINRFSNPDVRYNAVPSNPAFDRPTGVPIGKAGAADHRAVLQHAAGTVAAFRRTPVWLVAASGAGPWAERHVATERRDEIRLADLDGDGLADAVALDPDGGWRWSRSTRSAFERRGPSAGAPDLPLAAFRFADVDGDRSDDVFWISPTTGDWMYSASGIGPAKLLRTNNPPSAITIEDIVFGDFVGDARADVFVSDASTGTWRVSSGGSGPWQDYNPISFSQRVPTSALRFGQFGGDARTDVLQVRAGDPNGAGAHWLLHVNGVAKATQLHLGEDPPTSLDQIAVGEFDGDLSARDVLVVDGERWRVSAGGSGPLVEIKRSCHRLTQLWLADIDGDRITDVLRTGMRP